jgi:hypothetical protein
MSLKVAVRGPVFGPPLYIHAHEFKLHFFYREGGARKLFRNLATEPGTGKTHETSVTFSRCHDRSPGPLFYLSVCTKKIRPSEPLRCPLISVLPPTTNAQYCESPSLKKQRTHGQFLQDLY